MKILHLTTSSEWAAAQVKGAYTAPSLETEGFIHCSTAEQLLPVANAFYRDVDSPVVLWIEADQLTSTLRWEAPVPEDNFVDNKFPHVYGPLNLDAVVSVTPLKRNAAGEFVSF